MPEKIQIKKGDRYGKLTLTWRDEYRMMWSKKKNVRYVECICDCWKEIWTSLSSLRQGKTTSCWCTRWKKIIKHGMSNSNIYSVFKQARNRCTKKDHPQYKNYWWRWIKFLRENFQDFWDDMWDGYIKHCEEFWQKDTTLDRIDNSGNYCKENCRWATMKEQANNKRGCVTLEFEGVRYMSIMEFVEKNKWYNHSTISHRISRWMSVEEAITKPTSKEVIYKWKTYKSLTSLCLEKWMPVVTVSTRINNLWWTIEDAVDIPIDTRFRHKDYWWKK